MRSGGLIRAHGLAPLGASGLWTSRLGFGGAGIGTARLAEYEVLNLLERAVESGVRLFDTAPSYGESEARIGRHLIARHRDRIVVSTKVGYGVDGLPDWTGPCVTAGVEKARRQLGVDVIDVVHLHSCPVSVLERGDVVEALEAAVEAGRVRVAAYAGDGEGLSWAVGSGRFSVVQASFNLCDRANRPALTEARARGIGVLGKRSLANAPWRGAESAARAGAAAYDARWAELALRFEGIEPDALAVRYAVHHGPVDTALVGTRSGSRLEAAVRAVEAGPLPAEVVATLEERWSRAADGWGPVT